MLKDLKHDQTGSHNNRPTVKALMDQKDQWDQGDHVRAQWDLPQEGQEGLEGQEDLEGQEGLEDHGIFHQEGHGYPRQEDLGDSHQEDHGYPHQEDLGDPHQEAPGYPHQEGHANHNQRDQWVHQVEEGQVVKGMLNAEGPSFVRNL